VLVCADYVHGRDVAQLFKGAIPVNYFVVFADYKRGNGKALHDAVQQVIRFPGALVTDRIVSGSLFFGFGCFICFFHSAALLSGKLKNILDL
jgi:hypothetical protein